MQKLLSMCLIIFLTTTESVHANEVVSESVLKQLISQSDISDSDNIIILKNGQQVFNKAKTPEHQIKSAQSISKSLAAILYLFMIRDGFISGLDVRVSDHIKQYNTFEKKLITFRNIMTHTSGIYDGSGVPTIPDPFEAALRAQPSYPISRYFIYSSVASVALGELFRLTLPNSPGNKVENYLNSVLLSRIGLTEYKWPTYGNDLVDTSGGLEISPYALSQLGQFLLQALSEHGNQVIIDRSLLSTLVDNRVGIAPCYALMTWLVNESCGARAGDSSNTQIDKERSSGFYFDGFGGQYLVVIPSKGIVAVRMRRVDVNDMNPVTIEKHSFLSFPDLVSRL